MNPLTPPVERRPLRDSVVLKLFLIGLLILILLAPLGMVALLIGEREHRHDDVVRAVAETWGGAQTLGGPVLTVPYREIVTDEKGKTQTLIYRAHFLPEALTADGEVTPETRSRGIFDVVVYRAELRLRGSFRRPSFAAWPIDPKNVLWDEATLSFGIPDMRGIRRQAALQWRGRPLALAPGGGVDGLWTTGLRVPIADLGKAEPGERFPFAIDLGLNGTGTLRFLPFGEQTNVALRSTWPDPSFTGAFLPGVRTVSEKGFTASWSIPYFGRGYPQQWLASEADRVAPASAVQASAFGVDLYLPVDAYQKT
ncbi:MAG TPA: inner membrane CreD family protein, partial [Thermoanaerobaculia bacterium]